MSSATIAKRLAQAGPSGPIPGVVAELLRERHAHLVSGEPDVVPAAEVFRLWSTRLKNAHANQAPLEGAEKLLKESLLLPGDTELYQFSFVGSDVAAAVFFHAGTGAFLGYALMDQAKNLL